MLLFGVSSAHAEQNFFRYCFILLACKSFRFESFGFKHVKSWCIVNVLDKISIRYPILSSLFRKARINPGQNLSRQKLKIQLIQEMAQFFKFQILPLTPLYQCWIWPSFVVKSLKLCEQYWFRGRGVFSLKSRCQSINSKNWQLK